MACLLVRGTHEQLNRMAGLSPSTKPFTPTQGQYLAFVHLCTRLHRRPPAETDMQEYFLVSPPSVHPMVLTLERAGLIRRKPRTPRSILDQAKCLRERLGMRLLWRVVRLLSQSCARWHHRRPSRRQWITAAASLESGSSIAAKNGFVGIVCRISRYAVSSSIREIEKLSAGSANLNRTISGVSA